MLGVRHSPDRQANPALRELRPRRGEGNAAWVRRTGLGDGVLLLGGCSVAEFRIRVAQSRMRSDLLPSFWSMAGILQGSRVHTVADVRDLNAVPETNGIQSLRLREFDDPAQYPNIAVIRFCERRRPLVEAAGSLRRGRSLIDIPELIVPWVAYVWGVSSQANPLLESKGLPSAAFVETAHALVGIDLTPGLASEASCPEAIWQAAKWWTRYYEAAAGDAKVGDSHAICPVGRFGIRQPSAAVPSESASSAPGTPRRSSES